MLNHNLKGYQNVWHYIYDNDKCENYYMNSTAFKQYACMENTTERRSWKEDKKKVEEEEEKEKQWKQKLAMGCHVWEPLTKLQNQRQNNHAYSYIQCSNISVCIYFVHSLIENNQNLLRNKLFYGIILFRIMGWNEIAYVLVGYWMMRWFCWQCDRCVWCIHIGWMFSFTRWFWANRGHPMEIHETYTM